MVTLLMKAPMEGGSRYHLYSPDLKSCSLVTQMLVTPSAQGPHPVMGQRDARNIMSVRTLGGTACHTRRAGNNDFHSSHCKARRVSHLSSVQHRSDFLAMLIPLWEVQGQRVSPNKTDICLNSGFRTCISITVCGTHDWRLIL